MPTKDELTEQLSAMKARVAELEGAETALTDWADEPLEEGKTYLMGEEGLVAQEEGVSVRDRVVAVVGNDALQDAFDKAFEETGGNKTAWDELSEDEQIDLAMHVLMRPPATNDGDVEAAGGSDEVVMLRSDLQAVKIERDDARSQLQLARDRLRDAGTMHGSIDSLPPVV